MLIQPADDASPGELMALSDSMFRRTVLVAVRWCWVRCVNHGAHFIGLRRVRMGSGVFDIPEDLAQA